MRSLLLAVLLLSIGTGVNAQSCSTIQGMTPQTAIAVCGTTTFTQTRVDHCVGPQISGTGACGGPNASDNAFWYKFHCYQSGTLGFLVTPMNLNDDYDWELFDVTGVTNLNQIYTNESFMRSLNLCGNPNGVTGCTPFGIDSINCGGPTNLVNRLATIYAGKDYMLMVNNWSNSGVGYTLQFTGGTAVITENTPPVISSVSTIGCSNTLLKVVFSKDVLCSSVTFSGSEFSITPGTPAITNIISSCTSGANNITELTIQLQNPLPGGNYNLVVNPGTDGNTFTDVCGIDMQTGLLIPFTIPVIPPVAVSSITTTNCAPTFLDIALSKPVWCSSVTPSGSEFSITPGNPVITSVQSVCGTGPQYTSTLHIVLQNPLATGNYQLVINNGADGNTLVDTCNNSIPVGNSNFFTIPPTIPPPVIPSISFDQCHPDKVVVNFDKPVRCNSVTASGSELSITPGVWPINSITYNCISANPYTTQITMNLLNPLPAGNFNVVVGNGTDGNTLSDTCFSYMPVGYSKAFTATQAPPPVFDSVQVDKCNPTFVKVFYSHPILCSSVAANGSDFSITGPAAVNILSASTDVTCGTGGYTKWVLLQFSAAINTLGNYVLHNGIGSDGNGIIDTCSAKQNTAETISFSVFGKPSAVFTSVVNLGCVTDAIVLSHPGGNGINSWNWTFSDGSTATGQNLIKNFPVATPTVTIQLTVSNGSCSDTYSTTITLGNFIDARFTLDVPDTFCINTPVKFTDGSIGTITNFLWKFGDATQFTGQNPPTHIYAVTNIYNAQLIVTDNNGCLDTASRLLYVNTNAFIDFTGLRPQYCTGNPVVLTRKIANTITSYIWDNGDGKTFTNEVEVNFTYAREGVYTITLTGQDKYCGPSTVSKTVPVYDVPKVALGPDTVLCKSETMFIGVAPTANYSYLWNTGETTSQIYTSNYTRDYTLTADNNGCRGYDAMHVKILTACMIKVPGAFTPNSDGLNDLLKALNADLAKNFSFKVYNRLGQLVFVTNNPLEGWDGKFKGNPESTGTYVWSLSYTDPWTGKDVKTKGTSILIR